MRGMRLKGYRKLTKDKDIMVFDKPKYVYSNLKTGECIVSDNPNLLDELNAKHKKEKKQKTKIPKFNFKITYNENK